MLIRGNMVLKVFYFLHKSSVYFAVLIWFSEILVKIILKVDSTVASLTLAC